MATIPEDSQPTPPCPPGKAGASRVPVLVTRFTEAWQRPGSRLTLAGAAGAAAMLALIFWRNLLHFGISWSTDENYSHGFLVPLISLYFANQAAERGPVAVRGGVGLGVGAARGGAARSSWRRS